MEQPKPNDFEDAARRERPPSLLREFWGFLRHNRKWWLLPLLIVLLVLGALAILSGTGAAPFIYTFH